MGVSLVLWMVILSTMGILRTVGDIMSTVGKSLLLFEYPHGTEHPTVLMISLTCIMISHTVLKLQRMVPPMELMISLTCMVFMDIPWIMLASISV